MTTNCSLSSEQWGQFYMIFQEISGKLEGTLPYDEVIEVLKLVSGGEFKIGVNSSADLQQLCKRSPCAQQALELCSEKEISSIDEKKPNQLFKNEKYPTEVKLHPRSVLNQEQVLSSVQPGQGAGKILSYKVEGKNLSPGIMAAELLNIPNETPTRWTEKLLISRGYAVTLPVLECILEADSTESPLSGFDNDARIQCKHITFIEAAPCVVEVAQFKRHELGGLEIIIGPLESHKMSGGFNYRAGECRLIVRQ